MEGSQNIKFPRLTVKVIALLVILNIVCVLVTFLPIGRISLYNYIFPGRTRMPFGENPEQSYNLTMNNLDAMIASHEISGEPKNRDTFRIFVIGDSSIWGFLQRPENTLAGILKEELDLDCGGQMIEIYNFGYPSLSILKDHFFIHRAKEFDPDLVLWLVTLESLNRGEQLSTPLVMNNTEELNSVIEQYDLDFNPLDISLWDRSLFNQRRNFADMLRLQLYGVMWAATGIDQEYPETYTPAQRDFENVSSYKNYTDQILDENDLALEVITKTIDKISTLDFILINEPILISHGENSDIRYNFYYPRWAYDQYREIINNFTNGQGIKYFDLWDLVPEEHYTNSAIHLDKAGEEILAEELTKILKGYCEQ